MRSENEQFIRKFLFGEMSEEERFEFEEKFITDADTFEQIKVVEDELIEQYVRGWMNPAERSKFEKHFLTTEKKRERVEFSHQLINRLDEQRAEILPVKKNAETYAEESVWDKLAGLFLAPKIAFGTAFALLVIAFGGWFLYRNINFERPQIVRNENTAKTSDAASSITPEPINKNSSLPANKANNTVEPDEDQSNRINNEPSKSTDDPRVELSKTPRTSPENLNKTVKKTPVPVRTPVTPKTAPNPVLTLFAGTVRSGGKNNVLNLANKPKSATLQLNLESIDYKTYRAELTDADGNVIFKKENLKAGRSTINFSIPAEKISSGDYLIKLYGKNSSGENESVADYQFRVNK